MLTLAVLAGIVVAIVLFRRVSHLDSQLSMLRRQIRELSNWADTLYAWLQAERRATPAPREADQLSERPSVALEFEPEPEPHPAPEPVAPTRPERVYPARPAPPAAREPAAPKPRERAPEAKPEAPAAREPVIPRREPPVRPTEPKPPPVREPVARGPAVRPPEPKPEPPAAPEPAPPRPREPVRPTPAARPPQPAPAAPSAARRRPRTDIEVAIGTAWLTRIGMVAVLLAVAFLLSHAFTRGWITEPMVFAMGIVAGIGLLIGGESAHRRGYAIQGQALTGGGAAMLYLTLWAGQHLYGLMGGGITFLAMVVVTIAAAVQAIRHESETVATFAWITGYAVPLLIHGGSTAGAGDAAPLFGYLVMLSVAVFVVAQRHAWPFFTGLALLGAYSSGAYIFHVSDGALGWTLTYLMLVTAGTLWVSTTRRGRAGENFGAVGAVAGYLVTGTTMLAGGTGSAYIPYVYLLVLSMAALWLGHIQGWRSLRWIGALGSFVGFVLLFVLLGRAGVPHLGNWIVLYAAMSVAGSLAVSAGRYPDAEPLATTAVVSAYGAAAMLAWASPRGAVSDGAMFAYLGLLAAAVLLLTGRFAWPTFSRLGLGAAFLATGLLYEHLPTGVSLFPLMYLVMLAAGALTVTSDVRNRSLGGLTIFGVFVALPLTGMMGRAAPGLVAPVYLAVAAVATLAVIEWRKWHGMEWIPLLGTWLLYFIWRGPGRQLAPDPAGLHFTAAYVLIFLAATWVRHGLRDASARPHDGFFAGANAAALCALAYHDLGGAYSRGVLALALFALYLVAGLVAIRRRPKEAHFGPVLLAISIVFLTAAMPLLSHGYHMTAWWALEATVLMALGFHYRSPGLRQGALAVLILPLVRALVLDSQLSPDSYQLLLNSRALSVLAVIAATYIGAYLCARYPDRLRADEEWLGAGMTTLATLLLLWISSSEAWTFTGWQLGTGLAVQHFALSGVWVVFGAVLMAIGIRRDVGSLRWAGLGLLGATVIKVFTADPALTSASYLPLINAHAAPLLAITGLLYVAAWYARMKQADDTERTTGTALLVVATGLLFCVSSSEAWLYTDWRAGAGPHVQHLALSLVWLTFGGVMLILGMLRRTAALRWVGLALLAVTACKVLSVDPELSRSTYRLLANPHALPLIVIAALLYAISRWYARNSDHLGETEEIVAGGMPVVANLLVWWILTSEAWHFAGWWPGAGPDAQQYALSGIWTAYGAVLMAIGLILRKPVFRWTAMTLFAITILKVFFFDLRSLDIVYRILALLGLGAALIGVGFGYQALVREQAEHAGSAN